MKTLDTIVLKNWQLNRVAGVFSGYTAGNVQITGRYKYLSDGYPDGAIIVKDYYGQAYELPEGEGRERNVQGVG